MPTTQANGITLRYEVRGEGQPLLLINGLVDDLTSWGYQMPDFEARYRTIVFDNRGIGGSDKPAGGYTTADMAADAKGLLDALGIPRAHVLGVSMGGMIAQEFAIAYPDAVDKLVLCATCSEPSEANLRLYAFWQQAAPALGLPEMMKETLLWCFTPDYFQTHRDEARETEEALTSITQPVDAYLSQLHSIQAHNATDRLSRIGAQTLVLGAPRDQIFPPPQSEQIHRGIPGSLLQFTAHGGHAYLWEAPDEFNRAVIDFLG